MYTVAFDVSGHTLDLGVFRPFYRSRFADQYGLDSSQPQTFKCSSQEMATVIDSIATLPNVTDGGVDLGGTFSLSFSVVEAGVTKVFESVLDTTDSRLLFGRLLGGLPSNAVGRDAITQFACSLGLLPGPTVTDVSSRLSIVTRGFRKDRPTGRYVGRVRITNTSGQPIASPVILAFFPGENITLVGASGSTCAVFPHGAPFVTLPVGAALAPSQHIDVILHFDNPDDDRIVLNGQRVYAGQGFH